MKAQFDERDAQLKNKRVAIWNNQQGPRIGDYLNRLDGKLARFSWRCNDGSLQLSKSGSFYLADGCVSFSGGLDSPIPLDKIKQTSETKNGSFWFFHHNEAKADNGVYFDAPCRMFTELA